MGDAGVHEFGAFRDEPQRFIEPDRTGLCPKRNRDKPQTAAFLDGSENERLAKAGSASLLQYGNPPDLAAVIGHQEAGCTNGPALQQSYKVKRGVIPAVEFLFNGNALLFNEDDAPDLLTCGQIPCFDDLGHEANQLERIRE